MTPGDDEGAQPPESATSAPAPVRFLTTTEVGARLGVQAGKVSEWCRNGQIAARKNASGRWVVAELDLDAYLVRVRRAERSPGAIAYRAANGCLAAGGCLMMFVYLFWVLVMVVIIIWIIRA